MRNLKRALSLTLASVMLLGMMVIGTSAASFTDADQISNVTAATVLQELEVMQGSNGKFNPNSTVTRGQMAILICKMLYGSKLNAENFAGTSEFTDVPANAYYTGYVNLASQLGIISGYGNGKFGPGAPVTTAQAALMLTRALGWFQAGELENQNWTSNAIAAVEKATTVNLFGDLRLGNNDPLSRDNVAEMVFNALTKTSPVKYNERWDAYYTDEGKILDGVKFNYKNSLGYKNFTLVYNTTTDDFGRPATEWGIGNANGITTDDHGDIISATIRTSILKAEDEATLTYTKDVKLCDIYKDLGKPSLKKNVSGSSVDVVLDYKVNGKDANDNDGDALAVGTFATEESKVGGKGTLTEVFRTKDGDIHIRSVETYLVKANADYSTKNEELSVTPYGITLVNSSKIKNDDVTVSQFVKDDLILVTGVQGADGKLTVKTAELADKVENVKVSAYKGAKDYVTAGGTKYSYNAKMDYDPDTAIDRYNLQKTGYNLVLDKYDYVIGVEKYSSEVSLDEILFVKDAKAINWGWEAKVMLMDGSEKTVTIAGTMACPADAGNTNSADHKGDAYDSIGKNGAVADAADGTKLGVDGDMSKNRFYEFNVKSNGEYELKDIDDTRQEKITAGGASSEDLKGGELQPVKGKSKTATDATIFIAKDAVYTGAKNSPTVKNSDVYYLLDNDSQDYILAVYTPEKGVVTVDASEYVYVFTGNGDGQDEKDNKFYIYTAIKDGAKDEGFKANDDSKGTGLYKIESYENGYPVLGTAITADEADVLEYTASVANSAISYKEGVITAGGSYRMADEGQVYVVNSDDKDVDVIAASSVKTLEAGNYAVYAIQASKSNKDIVALWLVKAATPATRTVTAPAAKTDALGQKTTITASGTSAADGATVTYTVTLSETATETNKYTITLAGLTSVSVSNDSSAPSNWKAVEVSDTQIDIYVTNAAAVSGAVKISGTVNNNVTATIGNGAQTYRFQNATQATGANLTATVVADKEWATASEKVTYTVAIATATASNDAENDTFTVASTGGATSLTLAKDSDGNDVTLKNCSATGLVIKITANDTETNGSWTFSIDNPSANVQPTITYAAGT